MPRMPKCGGLLYVLQRTFNIDDSFPYIQTAIHFASKVECQSKRGKGLKGKLEIPSTGFYLAGSCQAANIPAVLVPVKSMSATEASPFSSFGAVVHIYNSTTMGEFSSLFSAPPQLNAFTSVVTFFLLNISILLLNRLQALAKSTRTAIQASQCRPARPIRHDLLVGPLASVKHHILLATCGVYVAKDHKTRLRAGNLLRKERAAYAVPVKVSRVQIQARRGRE